MTTSDQAARGSLGVVSKAMADLRAALIADDLAAIWRAASGVEGEAARVAGALPAGASVLDELRGQRDALRQLVEELAALNYRLLADLARLALPGGPYEAQPVGRPANLGQQLVDRSA